jgi:acyl-CoA hydrolase
MEGKTVSDSAILNQVIEVYPDDLDAEGTLFAGRIMQIVNSLALTVAKRHAECGCIALGIDSVRFQNPASHGDILLCTSSVTRTWPTTLEVGVKVIAEDFRSLEQKDIFSAYFTFGAVDDEQQPIEIAPIILEEPDDSIPKNFSEEPQDGQLAKIL